MTTSVRPAACCLLSASAIGAVFAPSDRERLGDLVEIVGVHSTEEDFLANHRLAEVEILVAGWGTPRLSVDLLDAMPSLRLVLYSAGSIRHLVTDEFWKRGVAIVSAADANNEPVADYVAATIVLALKGEHHSIAHLQQTQAYLSDHSSLGIYGRRVGLVGFGSIARKVTQRLSRFRHELSVWDPYLDAAVAGRHGVHSAKSLPELFAGNDLISIHAPWQPGVNDHMIGEAELRAMRPRATLINTARGALVDQAALIEVLQDRPDLYAVLDVTDPEPLAVDSPLHQLPNVKLTGHIAGSIGTERHLLGRLILGELQRWLTGVALEHDVTEGDAARRA